MPRPIAASTTSPERRRPVACRVTEKMIRGGLWQTASSHLHTGSAKNQPGSATPENERRNGSSRFALLFLRLTPFREQLGQKRTSPVMGPLHSDAACPILLGPLSGPAAGAVHW